MADGRAILKISDGTDEIDLLQAREEFKSRGWLHFSWTPEIAQWKGGGTWSQSALSDGRQLRYFVYDNVIETINCRTNEFGQDELIELAEDTMAMLQKAAYYWASGWTEDPVYLICRATEETNTRYAIVKGGNIPRLQDWYAQPFIQENPACDAVFDDINIIIERGHWQDTIPGSAGNCLEAGTIQEWCSTYPLSFDGDTSDVDLGSPAALDNLAVGASFAVEAWIYANSFGELSNGYIADKSANATEGWSFQIDSTVGLVGKVFFDVQDAVSESGTDEFGTAQLNGWHHVAMSFDNATKQIRLYIDFAEVTSYVTQQAGNNAALSDTAADAYIGNRADGANGFDGLIGWLRIWSTTRTFTTEQPRCPLPGTATSVEWLGIYEGTGTTIRDLSGNGNNGTASNTSWGACCEKTYGNYSDVDGAREESCDPVYIANKHNVAQLTHIFVEDGGVFGGNLLAATPPYSLLPAVPVANDRCYFGIQDSVLDGGPFCSLVFDLSQVHNSASIVRWEYWNGAAWVGLSVQDNTDNDGAAAGGTALDTLGVRSVHWEQPSNWAETAVNGVTAFWVRVEVQGALNQASIQQNRHVYTITWPYVEVQASRVGGTLTNLIEMFVRNESDHSLGAVAPDLWSDRVIVGTRSYSRGADFSPWINMSEDQQPGGWTVTEAGGNYTFQANVETATGRMLQCLNPPAAGALVARAETSSVSWFGKYHAFLVGNATDTVIEAQLRGRTSVITAPQTILTNWFPFPSTVDGAVVDLENIRIPFAGDVRPEDFGIFTTSTFFIEVYLRGDGVEDANLYELILMPVDECAIDSYDPQISSTIALVLGDRSDDSTFLDIDSIQKPKSLIRSMLKFHTGETFALGYRTVANGPAVLQANARQRIWFFQMDISTGGSAIGSQPEVASSVELFNVQRYLGARGSR